nr:MAG TPA: hypothetical protein [Caudoviricetes sp.]
MLAKRLYTWFRVYINNLVCLWKSLFSCKIQELEK